MATVEQRLMTADEFFLMPPIPDGSAKVELVRGEIVTMCRPGFEHGYCQGRTYAVLDHYGRSTGHGRATVETGVVTERQPDTVRGPDVSYWSIKRLPLDKRPKGYPEVAPDLAVEVLSPHNRMSQIQLKMEEYFARGVCMCWIVDPEDRTLAVYRAADQGQIFHASATFAAEDILPGFSLKVAELFD